MKQDHKGLPLRLHSPIRKRLVLRKKLLRYLTHLTFSGDQYLFLDNSPNSTDLSKRIAVDIVRFISKDNVNCIVKALQLGLTKERPFDKFCFDNPLYEQEFRFELDSYGSYLIYFAWIVEELGIVQSSPLHLEISFRLFSRFWRPLILLPAFIDTSLSFISRKEPPFKKDDKESCMQPVPSYFEYLFKRELFVKDSLCRGGGGSGRLGKDFVSICTRHICSHIKPRITLHEHEDLVASLKFFPSSSSATPILCTFALDDKIRLFQGAHCRTVVAGPVQQTGGTVISSNASSSRVGQVAACSLRAELDIYDMEVGERVTCMFAPSSLIVPKGRIEWYTITSSSWSGLITTGGNYGVVALWDSRVSHPVEFFQANTKSEEQKIRSVAIDPTETLLAAAYGRTISIWDIRHSFSVVKSITSSSPAQGPIDHILFDPLFSFTLYAGYRDGSIHSMNLFEDNKPVEKIFKQHEAPSVANRPVSVNFDASPDGRHLFSLARFGKVGVYDAFGNAPVELKTESSPSPVDTASSHTMTSPMVSIPCARSNHKRRISSFLGTLGDEPSELVRIATGNNLSSGADILLATASTSLDVTLWGVQ